MSSAAPSAQDLSPTPAIESLPPLPEGKELELEPEELTPAQFFIEYDLTQPSTPGTQSRRDSYAGNISRRGSLASFSKSFNISVPFSVCDGMSMRMCMVFFVEE
uniref:Uncharacterized protein n=1 Tax=Caenorhabditis japonica TaxID=281687 RepID=A0A8R1DWT3_CAEJA